MNENEDTIHQNLWNAAKTVLVVVHTYMVHTYVRKEIYSGTYLYQKRRKTSKQ